MFLKIRHILQRNFKVVLASVAGVLLLITFAGLDRSTPNGGMVGELPSEGVEANASLPPTALDPCLSKDVVCPKEDLAVAIEASAQAWNVPEWLMKGIAQAETSFGKNAAGFNAFSIKGGKKFKTYANWYEATEDAARIIRNFYLDEGKTTPEKMVMKYVGEYDTRWISIVNHFKES